MLAERFTVELNFDLETRKKLFVPKTFVCGSRAEAATKCKELKKDGFLQGYHFVVVRKELSEEK